MINEVNDKKQISNNYLAKTPYMGRYVLVVTDHFIDWYKGGGGIYTYMTSVYQSSSMEYVYVEDDYSGGGNGYETPNYHSNFDAPHGPALGLNNHPDEVIDNTRNPCVGSIIRSIQEKDMNGALVPDLSGKSHLSQVVLDLFGECKNYDLIINVAELGTGPNGGDINAKTNGISSITLDDDLIKDATQLSIAKTLIHESMHLYMNWVMRKAPNSDISKDLKAYFEESNNSNLSHHQFMSDYVEAIAYSLSAYDNHREDMSYYEAMSWGGLESSDAYKALDSTKQEEIQKIISNERFNKNDAKSSKCP